MQTFEVTLSESSWTEVLNGGASIAFDLISVAPIYVYFTESAADPGSVTGNVIYAFPGSTWDFSANGLEAGTQRIWLKGNNSIRGIR